MAELLEAHLGVPANREGPTVAEQVQAAYEEVCARRVARASRASRAR
ncbi:hypothetical protein WME99_05170 [Sorangium sp. So ce136]